MSGFALDTSGNAPSAYERCQKRGSHRWRPATMDIDPLTSEVKVFPSTLKNGSHRACEDCGKVLPV